MKTQTKVQPKVKVDPDRAYSLMEIAELGLIPGVTSREIAYNLATNQKRNKNNARTRVPCTKTTDRKLKAVNSGKPFWKITGKLFVKGEDILKFLELNHLS